MITFLLLLFFQANAILSDVDHLPSSLSILHYGYNEHETNFDNLPPSLSSLSFCASNNDQVNHLPSSLTSLSLHLGIIFDGSLDHLPSSLLHLSLFFNLHATCFLDHLPSSLTSLNIYSGIIIPLFHLPPSLTLLKVTYHDESFHFLPSSVSHLSYFSNILKDHNIEIQSISFIPDSITSLLLPNSLINPLPSLPSSLLHLTFDMESRFNHSFPPLPSSLQTSTLGIKFKHPLSSSLPLSLLWIKVCETYKYKSSIPSHIEVKTYPKI